MEVRVPNATANGMPYVVEVSGDIDLATVADLEGPVIDAIRDGNQPVILDLSDCPFIDSAGIRLLLRANHALADSANGDGRNVLAVIARDHVAGLLRLTAVDKVISVTASRAEAEAIVRA
jgi:anti-anti-sigma factor